MPECGVRSVSACLSQSPKTSVDNADTSSEHCWCKPGIASGDLLEMSPPLSLSRSLSLLCASEVPPPTPSDGETHKQMCRHGEGKKAAFLFSRSLIYRVVSAQMSQRWGPDDQFGSSLAGKGGNQEPSRGFCPP